MLGIDKPLPLPTEDSEAYWESCHRGRLSIPRCRACRHWFLPPAPLCPACWSEDVALEPVAGRGRLYSWIVVHRPQHPAFFADAPYLVAIVELDEGPRMHAGLVDVEPGALAIGLPLEVGFQRVADEINLPVFRPAAR